MLRALTTAATGMLAQQNYLDVIANNVANVNTTGFKKNRIEFQDLLSQAQRTPGAVYVIKYVKMFVCTVIYKFLQTNQTVFEFVQEIFRNNPFVGVCEKS